jgi:hypothetical protein
MAAAPVGTAGRPALAAALGAAGTRKGRSAAGATAGLAANVGHSPAAGTEAVYSNPLGASKRVPPQTSEGIDCLRMADVLRALLVYERDAVDAGMLPLCY